MNIDQKKLVSIIMPFYNAEKFIDISINSIVNQTYKNFELILINDGSTDKSIEIVKSYLPDKRLKFFSLKKKGIAPCLNFGLKKAKGHYVARMDADDISHLNRIKKQVEFLNDNPKYHLVGSGAKYIGKINFFSKLVPKSNNDCKASLIFKNPFIHPTIMIRKKTILSLGGYKNYFKSEDYELWSSFFERYKGINLKDNLIDYRVHSNQHSLDNNSKVHHVKLIQKKWLKKLGIKNLKKKLDFHYKLSVLNEKFNYDRNFKNYEKYLYWLLDLKNHNNKNIFNKNSFDKIIYINFICATLAFSEHGIKTYTSFKKSQIYKRNMLINLIIILFCYFKVTNFYLKKFFWYMIQLSILR